MLLTKSILDETTLLAQRSERLRMNWNIHSSFEDSVQRMFNALEPGTEVPIARHPYSGETLIILRGRLRVMIYDDEGRVVEDVVIAAGSDNIGYHIPMGTWHKVESLETGTICFETREGPYRPVEEGDVMNGQRTSDGLP